MCWVDERQDPMEGLAPHRNPGSSLIITRGQAERGCVDVVGRNWKFSSANSCFLNEMRRKIISYKRGGRIKYWKVEGRKELSNNCKGKWWPREIKDCWTPCTFPGTESGSVYFPLMKDGPRTQRRSQTEDSNPYIVHDSAHQVWIPTRLWIFGHFPEVPLKETIKIVI